MSVLVRSVCSRSQENDFFSLRRQIYQNDPSAVFHLSKMERQLVDVDQHPFYQHGSRELFVAYRDGKPVGRVAAIKDDLQRDYDGNRLGFFGFFECENDHAVARQLLNAATRWLVANDCDTVRGPVNPSMKGEFGVLVSGHETTPSIMTMHNHQYYKALLEAEGFSVVRSFFSFLFESSTADSEAVSTKWKKLFSARDRILKRFPQLSFRAVDKSSFESVMRDVNSLSNRVRSAGWGYVPLTEAELNFMITNLRRVIRYDMIHVAYWNDEMVGYIVNIPDVNWALKRTWGTADWMRMIQLPFLIPKATRSRVIALGVDEAFRTKGIAMLLIARLVEVYDQFDEWEFSWVDAENMKSIRAIERTLPLVQNKKFELYEKSLETTV